MYKLFNHTNRPQAILTAQLASHVGSHRGATSGFSGRYEVLVAEFRACSQTHQPWSGASEQAKGKRSEHDVAQHSKGMTRELKTRDCVALGCMGIIHKLAALEKLQLSRIYGAPDIRQS